MMKEVVTQVSSVCINHVRGMANIGVIRQARGILSYEHYTSMQFCSLIKPD